MVYFRDSPDSSVTAGTLPRCCHNWPTCWPFCGTRTHRLRYATQFSTSSFTRSPDLLNCLRRRPFPSQLYFRCVFACGILLGVAFPTLIIMIIIIINNNNNNLQHTSTIPLRASKLGSLPTRKCFLKTVSRRQQECTNVCAIH